LETEGNFKQTSYKKCQHASHVCCQLATLLWESLSSKLPQFMEVNFRNYTIFDKIQNILWNVYAYW